jgi:hypothetical protein
MRDWAGQRNHHVVADDGADESDIGDTYEISSLKPGVAIRIGSFSSTSTKVPCPFADRGGSDDADLPLPDGCHPAPARTAAPEAYQYLSTPDALLGLVSYGVTAWLASMGGENRARTQPWLPLMLAGKVAIDAANSGRSTIDQWTKHRAFCSWCLLASCASFATVPFVIPEARAALGMKSKRT